MCFFFGQRKSAFTIYIHVNKMGEDDHTALLNSIKSKEFDISQCIKQLRIHSNTIGIHHYLIQKLSTYSYEEIEFYIPQFIQLLVSYETNSMALEDFLLNYSSIYPHFSLVVFWTLQAYIFELRNDPESYSFQIVRRFINQLQNIIFNSDVPVKKPHEFRENLHPGLVAIGSIVAASALPKSCLYTLPVIKSQSKQQKAFVFQLANFQKALTRNLTLKNLRIVDEEHTEDQTDNDARPVSPYRPHATSNWVQSERNSSSITREEYLSSEDERANSLDSASFNSYLSTKRLNDLEDNLRINTVIKSKRKELESLKKRSSDYSSPNLGGMSQSLPDLRDSSNLLEGSNVSPIPSEISLSSHQRTNSVSKRSLNNMLSQQKILLASYARRETDFIMSLQNISFRLSQIPKEARLSALRAELSMINESILPSEIDIPQLLPLTSQKNKRYHKILKLNVNEACVLNSAERVPFLLLIEYLSDDFDFDPTSEGNQRILSDTSTYRSGLIEDFKQREETLEVKMKALDTIDATDCVSTISSTDVTEADLGDLDATVDSNVQDLERLKLLDATDTSEANLRHIESQVQTSTIPSKVLASQMRIASVMLQQLEDAGKENTEQSSAIKNRIIESMISLQDQFETINYDKLNELKGDDPNAGERKMENDFKIGEDWDKKKLRIKRASVYGHLKNWDICSVIAKNGDDLPQEAFACQLITIVSNLWKAAKIQAWTKKMRILITSANTGLVETINNAMSIHSIKKSLTEHSIAVGDNSKGRIFSLLDYFEKLFGDQNSKGYKKAQENFARSLASYSILSYIFQIKDRHNGNIMLDNEGHIIHIDFGFILSNSPGSLGFEAAPFKLTQEYVDLMGGQDSTYYRLFKEICTDCFKEVRRQHEQIIDIVELMQKDSNLPCFNNGENTSVLLKQRLQLQLDDTQVVSFVENALIAKSLGSMYTRLYDQFQMVTQGIYS